LEILRPGDVFGELSAPPADGRASDLVALEDTQTVMLPADLIQRLQRDHVGVALHLAQNLVNVLRQRVDDLHLRSAEWTRRERSQLLREQTIPPLEAHG
jgi:CRP-like cAMP-binding protein